MVKKSKTTWDLDPHTQAKHIILRKYLDAWLPIMTSISGRVLYIDGFAGPGEYENGEEGSPIIALNAALKHQAKLTAEIIFIFIETDKDRFDHLEQQVRKLTLPNNLKYHCIHGKFDETVSGLFDYLDGQRRNIAPIFAFIDPFGYSHTPFEVVKRIMSHDKCEILITFMYEEINRFIKHPDSRETEHRNRLYGTDRWQEARNIQNPQDRKQFLHNLYKEQLKSEAGVKYVRSFEMINKGNRTDYFLFFGTNNKIGFKKMKEAMWRVDPLGAFQFSDATTNPNQLLLFEPTPNYSLLKKMILDKFKGKEVLVEDIDDFVLVHTPFINFKRPVLMPLEKASPPEIEVIHSSRKKKHSYPDGTKIRFL